jgi:hypothetical protein
MMITDAAEKKNNIETLSTDEAYDILSDQRRRYAIHHLKQLDTAVSVQDLAEQVAAWENEKPIEQLNSQERKRVYISLYQSHLSTLDDEGIVEYDEENGMVSLTDAADELNIYFEVVAGDDIPWSIFYIGLTAAFSALVGLTYTGIGVLQRSQLIFVTIGMLVSYTAAGVIQTIQRKRMELGDSGPPPELQ